MRVGAQTQARLLRPGPRFFDGVVDSGSSDLVGM